MWAAYNGHSDIVKELLGASAKVHVKGDKVSFRRDELLGLVTEELSDRLVDYIYIGCLCAS